MKKTMLYVVTTLGISVLYQLLLMLGIHFTAGAEKPDWWPNGFVASWDGFFVWVHLAQGLGVLLAAVIVAWLIQRFFRRHWLIISFCASLFPMFLMFPPFWLTHYMQSDLWWSGLLDTAKFLLLPPFCCWVMVRYQQLYADNNS